MSEQVVAQVILRSRAGLSVLEATEPITAENVAKYKVDEAVIQEASRKLLTYGIKVEAAGPHSLSISSDKTLFERVFHTRLEARSTGPEGAEISGGAAFFYEAKDPIEIPDDLSSLVSGVVLSTPPELFP